MALDVTSKKLMCNFALDEDGEKKYVLSLSDPKDDLTLSMVSSVMEGAVDNNVLLVTSNKVKVAPVAFVDAYVETTTKTYLS